MPHNTDMRADAADGYRRMASQAGHRPYYGNAPSLDQEGKAYSMRWLAEEDTGAYRIGCPDFTDRHLLIFLVEAARCLCGMDYRGASKLLRLASTDLVKKEGYR